MISMATKYPDILKDYYFIQVSNLLLLPSTKSRDIISITGFTDAEA